MTRSLIGFSILAAAAAVIPKFLMIGFTHILPQGLDHILCILGLFFLSRSLPALLFQMTLFTLAHSLTLGLSIYGFVSVPTQVVEVAIALSIAFIAIENVFQRPSQPVATGRGLLFWAHPRDGIRPLVQ